MTTLWKHQQLAVQKARHWAGGHKDLALFLETGTGKTLTLITILREEYAVSRKIENTLIFAPISVCLQWKREFLKVSKIPDSDILVLTGSGKKRAEALEDRLRSGRPAIVVTNYEAVQIKAFYDALLRFSPAIVALDESHRIKDSSSLRAKAIYPIAAAARRRFLLTGTPIVNSMLDIFGQFKALDSDIFGGNFYKFRLKYFYDKNAGMPSHIHFPDWQPRPEAASKIGATIGRYSVQAKKSECLDLPPLLKVPVPVSLSSEQARIYFEMEKHFIASLENEVTTAEFAMTKTIRLQQIIAGFLLSDDTKQATWVKENPRMKALEDLLETIGPKEKTIIWTVFKPTYGKIGELCDRIGRSYSFLTGEQTAGQKDTAIESFCRGSTQILIANAASGGAGLNLQEAKYAIYYGRGYSLEHYLQSEARNYRGGSNMHDRVTHYHLTAEGTLDEIIAAALGGKKDVADSVLEWARRREAMKSKGDFLRQSGGIFL